MQQVTTREEADAVFDAEFAILYKHSSRCPSSSEALREIRRFQQLDAGVMVYLIDVIADRPVSQYVAARSGITHHSPQVLVLRRGICAWHASHHRITSDALLRQATLAGEPHHPHSSGDRPA
jgi:bacillithiol system protein YtxJ